MPRRGERLGDDRGHSAPTRRARKFRLRPVLVVLTVLALALGAAAYFGTVPGLDGASDDPQPPAELAAPPALVPGVDLAEPAPPRPVLADDGSAGPPAANLLRQALQAPLRDRSLGSHVGFVVRDLRDPSIRWAQGSQVVTPASTLKLLTAATALETLGPEHRFSTTVVAGGSRREIVLVGGGDPLLTDKLSDASIYPRPATLATLARRTAQRLAQDGVSAVRLGYDTSLFSGPAVSPAWEPDYIEDNVVSPITALWVDEGREVAGFADRSADPAAVAAQRFAAALARNGIAVRGTPMTGRAEPAARELAAVESAPLVQIVQHVLEASDNEGAEVLLRQAAVATERPGSFGSGVQTLRTTLTGLGVDLSGAELYDGSGLARGNRLSVRALVDVLVLAATPSHPELNAVLTSLPVAGFTGSLTYRFVDVADSGLGVVRAKTGTLTGVHGLAGLAVRPDGRPLVFAAVADRVPVVRTLDARAQLDRIAATIATCACT